jgi:putative membrane protein insertion efficiency factor
MIKRLCIFIITLYRVFISPLKPPTCRFVPTCSEYAIMAIEKYGVLRGTVKAIWRILRCNPFCRGGHDPV